MTRKTPPAPRPRRAPAGHGRAGRGRALRARAFPGALAPLAILLSVSIWLSGAAALRAAECRQALALALDVSGSVDRREYELQRYGVALALLNPQVRQALLAPGAPVEIMVFEWSVPGEEHILLPWTAITSDEALTRAVSTLHAAGGGTPPQATGLGSAIHFGLAQLAKRGCTRRTLDVSGDGQSNVGPHPAPLRQLAEKGGITINALVIGPDPSRLSDGRIVETAELEAYFEAYVIAGPNAFTETAAGFEAYEAAMVRKLLRELGTMEVSQRLVAPTGALLRPGRRVQGPSLASGQPPDASAPGTIIGMAMGSGGRSTSRTGSGTN